MEGHERMRDMSSCDILSCILMLKTVWMEALGSIAHTTSLSADLCLPSTM